MILARKAIRLFKFAVMKLPRITLALVILGSITLTSCKSSFANYVDPLYLEDDGDSAKSKQK